MRRSNANQIGAYHIPTERCWVSHFAPWVSHFAPHFDPSIVNNPERLAEIRTRLSHISWFMRMVAEPVARRANAEEGISGRFWQGRFRSVKLCDEAAVLACSVYVDLNAVRAGTSQTPEDSPHTSASLRAKALRDPTTNADARFGSDRVR